MLTTIQHAQRTYIEKAMPPEYEREAMSMLIEWGSETRRTRQVFMLADGEKTMFCIALMLSVPLAIVAEAVLDLHQMGYVRVVEV